jgi:hypothetical protein
MYIMNFNTEKEFLDNTFNVIKYSKIIDYLVEKLYTNLSLQIYRFSIFNIDGKEIVVDNKSFYKILDKCKKFYILHEKYEKMNIISRIEKLLLNNSRLNIN